MRTGLWAVACTVLITIAFGGAIGRAQTAELQGIVVRAGTTSPLSNAAVELRADGAAPNAPPISTTTTEDDGRFIFPSVRPGKYRLLVTRAGYVRPETTVTVAAGAAAPFVQLAMTPTSAIFGRVTNARNEPAPYVEVHALRATIQEGRRVLTTVQVARTNDLGEYRLFWLAPGRYYVSAVAPGSGGSKLPGGGQFTLSVGPGPRPGSFVTVQGTSEGGVQFIEPASDDKYVAVFFPGTTDERAATPIDLGAGSDFGSVNLTVSPVRERRVRGVILNGSTGLPAQYASLRTSREFSSFSADKMQVHPDRATFDVGLLPGSHTLIANSSSGSGFVSIQVGDADLDNVTIVTTPYITVKGRMTVEGKPIPNRDLEELRISLRLDPAVPGTENTSYSTVIEDGTFTVREIAGRYRVNVAPLLNLVPPRGAIPLPRSLEGAYVKAIRLGTLDVLNEGLRLDKAPAAPLEVVIGTNAGSVAATVVDDRQLPVADATVVLLPNVRRRTELYRDLVSDASGRVQFDRVPPGDYRIFTWFGVTTGAWYDPEFVRGYEAGGVPVRIGEGRTETVRIPLVGR